MYHIFIYKMIDKYIFADIISYCSIQATIDIICIVPDNFLSNNLMKHIKNKLINHGDHYCANCACQIANNIKLCGDCIYFNKHSQYCSYCELDEFDMENIKVCNECNYNIFCKKCRVRCFHCNIMLCEKCLYSCDSCPYINKYSYCIRCINKTNDRYYCQFHSQ